VCTVQSSPSVLGVFARSAALLANAEEHTGLSRVLSQLAEVEEKVETHQQDQADRDFFVLCELAKDYVGIMGAVKVGCLGSCA
jgi:sorting nexin-1/2